MNPVKRSEKQCFADGQKDPSARPSLEKWLAILSKESEFDVEGIGPSDGEFDDAEQENLGRNWQDEIRQRSTSSNRTQPTSTQTPSQTEKPASPSSGGDKHWADNIRGSQPARASGGNRQQSAGQQFTGQPAAGQQSTDQVGDEERIALAVLGVALAFLMLIIFLGIAGVI